MTNAERICAMTEEELRDFLLHGFGCPPCYRWKEEPDDCITKRVMKFKGCSECWNAWLREEVEDEK